MNYIKHLNAVFKQFSMDNRLNPTHISLYVALFQFWNIHRFPQQFYIHRDEVMKMAKIGSKATYHRCLKSLHNWKYIRYLPSHNPYKGSQVQMLIFGTSSETSGKQVEGQALVPYSNSTKPVKKPIKHKLPESKKEVLVFFKKQNWPALEGEKFFNHYDAISWKIGGKIKITNWYAAAENWMLKFKEIQASQTERGLSQNRDNLKTKKAKDYDQPL